jgi:hypothetical protein
MQQFKTILKVVVSNEKNKKVWKVIRNDYDNESVGMITVSGVPCRAEDTDLDSTYETTLTIPEPQDYHVKK